MGNEKAPAKIAERLKATRAWHYTKSAVPLRTCRSSCSISANRHEWEACEHAPRRGMRKQSRTEELCFHASNIGDLNVSLQARGSANLRSSAFITQRKECTSFPSYRFDLQQTCLSWFKALRPFPIKKRAHRKLVENVTDLHQRMTFSKVCASVHTLPLPPTSSMCLTSRWLRMKLHSILH